MMHEPDTTQSPFVTAFARQRRQVLVQAAPLLGEDATVRREDAVPKLAALLAASLEELKVAEEEMILQQDALSDATAEAEREARHFRQLFSLAPVALLVTDLFGTIRHVNGAAEGLLRREAQFLDGKPLPALLPRTARGAFRDAIARLALTTEPRQWQFTIERPTHTPIAVIASAQLAPDARRGQQCVIWSLRPADARDPAPLSEGND